jgi:hypothetical protein
MTIWLMTAAILKAEHVGPTVFAFRPVGLIVMIRVLNSQNLDQQ